MKRLLSISVICLMSGVAFAAGPSGQNSGEKFYGKITAINQTKKNLTVHNARQQTDADFQWDDQTNVSLNKKPIVPTELKVGQSLMISYVTENDLNRAKRIMVRTPFKKSQQ